MPIPNKPFFGAITTPVYVPALRDIYAITNAFPALVTTAYTGGTAAVNGTMPGPHGYQSGLIVRLVIPPFFGMEAPQTINGSQGVITVVDANSFTISLDTTNWGTFVTPPLNPGHSGSPAQVIPVGEVTSQLTQSFHNQLPPQ